MLDVFCADYTTEKNVFWCVGHAGRHATRTINEIDALHECDVLPHLGLTRDRSHSADLLLPKSVDDRRFTSVRVSNQPNRDLLAIGVQGGKLTKQLNQRALAKRVVDVGMESESRVIFRQMANPSGLVRDAMLATDHQISKR